METRSNRLLPISSVSIRSDLSASLVPFWKPSHPAIEILSNPMKSTIGRFFNRHTSHKRGDAGISETKTAGEAKAKGEEKANRHTRKLKNP
jgi:hypothetical protein